MKKKACCDFEIIWFIMTIWSRQSYNFALQIAPHMWLDYLSAYGCGWKPLKGCIFKNPHELWDYKVPSAIQSGEILVQQTLTH